MYSSLSFPEYVIKVLSKSVEDFEPGYIKRFESYSAFSTTFPNFNNFYDFYTLMLRQAKKISQGKIKLKIEPDYPTLEKHFKAYNFYDEFHLHPVLTVEILINSNRVKLNLPPF